ncbi:TPA: hypothetical protein TZC31_001952 [Streptococcus suis]|nr:hypothetical protein [Streptococcus suis]
MSKQKVVSSLLLSTVVLGGLAFYSTTTVKAESLEPDVTSVSSSDATNKLVVSNEEESDFLAEEELEDDETLEEELNEQAEEVAEPSSPEALLQPRAVMSDSMSSDMEEIQVKDEPSDNTAEKVEKQQSPLIQISNADSKTGGDRETIKKSVTVNLLNAEEGQIQWEVRFDTSAWSFKESPGGFYFVLPKGLELTEIIDNDHGKMNIINNFPKNVNVPENAAKKKYRFFSEEEDQGSFNDQWGWSVGQATPDTTVNSWKSDNRFSKIYFVDQITDTTQVTYTLTAKVTASDQKSFPLMAVMKSFGYKNHSWTEFTSLGARMITLEKEKTLPPKEEAPKPELEAPKPEMPEAPQVPEEQPKDTPAPEVQKKNQWAQRLINQNQKLHKRHRLRKKNHKYRKLQNQYQKLLRKSQNKKNHKHHKCHQLLKRKHRRKQFQHHRLHQYQKSNQKKLQHQKFQNKKMFNRKHQNLMK